MGSLLTKYSHGGICGVGAPTNHRLMELPAASQTSHSAMGPFFSVYLMSRQGKNFLFGEVTHSVKLELQQNQGREMSHRTERRRRKKAREQIDLPPPLNPPLDVRNGRHGDLSLFADPKNSAADLRLVRRAIREGWEVDEKMRCWLSEAIMDVANMPLTKCGIDELTVNRNAIAATRTIIAMEVDNMRRDKQTMVCDLPSTN